MLRFFAGVASALLLVAAGFFLWKSRAQTEEVVPPAPPGAGLIVPVKSEPVPVPPAATEKTREEKRFARADRDDDGRITRAELLQPREKAFARLDKDGNGTLSFEEWAITTITKFNGADRDRNGWLSPREYETTRPKPPKKKACRC